MRRYVIGDIHGCSKALRALVDEIAPERDDTLIFLGDFIDRGPDSRGVLDLIIDLAGYTRVVPLRGNHELMMMGVLFGGLDPDVWIRCGGHTTIANYGGNLERVPDSHIQFLQSLHRHHETEREIFIHAGYLPECAIEQTDDAVRYWNHPQIWPGPHRSGKRAYVGHTPQPDGEVLNLGHLVCVDTYCFGDGWLTAVDLDSHATLQASKQGHLRRVPLQTMLNWFKRIIGRDQAEKRSASQASDPGRSLKALGFPESPGR